MKNRESVPPLQLSTGPVLVGALDLAPMPARSHVTLPLLPDGVPEPSYEIRRNKVRCNWCGALHKTRAKYVRHYKSKHRRFA